MAFTIPEGLHPDLNPLAWMIGTWRGKGRGEYPTIDTFEYAHEVVFNHDGRPLMNYYSRSWIIDSDGEILRPGGSEAGFWRVKPNNVLEVVDENGKNHTFKIYRVLKISDKTENDKKPEQIKKAVKENKIIRLLKKEDLIDEPKETRIRTQQKKKI